MEFLSGILFIFVHFFPFPPYTPPIREKICVALVLVGGIPGGISPKKGLILVFWRS